VRGKSGIANEFCAAVGHSFERQNHFRNVRQVIAGFVKQAVTQSCPNQYAEKAIEEERVELCLRQLLMAVEFINYNICQSQTYRPQE
jgi:hypothetical protein